MTSTDPTRHWDGQQWLRWNGSQWIAEAQPMQPYQAPTPMYQAPYSPSAPQFTSDKTGQNVQMIVAWVFAALTLGYFLPWAIAASRRKGQRRGNRRIEPPARLDDHRLDSRARHGLRLAPGWWIAECDRRERGRRQLLLSNSTADAESAAVPTTPTDQPTRLPGAARVGSPQRVHRSGATRDRVPVDTVHDRTITSQPDTKPVGQLERRIARAASLPGPV